MDEERQYEIKGPKWFQRFESPEVEREFTLEFNADALNSARIGLFIIIFVWIIYQSKTFSTSELSIA